MWSFRICTPSLFIINIPWNMFSNNLFVLVLISSFRYWPHFIMSSLAACGVSCTILVKRCPKELSFVWKSLWENRIWNIPLWSSDVITTKNRQSIMCNDLKGLGHEKNRGTLFSQLANTRSNTRQQERLWLEKTCSSVCHNHLVHVVRTVSIRGKAQIFNFNFNHPRSQKNR